MPDFDIDFCQDGASSHRLREAQVRHGQRVADRNVRHDGAKAAVRDVGRVLDLPYGFVDGIAKLIPFQPGKQ